MKRTILLLICVLSAIVGAFAQAQTAADALKQDDQSLRERYLVMKSKSQNYQEYKVIREYILDGFWKIALDSVQAKQAAISQSKAEISRLNGELSKNIAALKAKEDSMKEIVHASTHIRVFGINFNKGFFAGMIGVILLILGLAIAAIVYTMKMIRKSLTEKDDLVNALSAEYEDYKRKAMDKQTKLSRELQNERNKLQELGSL